MKIKPDAKKRNEELDETFCNELLNFLRIRFVPVFEEDVVDSLAEESGIGRVLAAHEDQLKIISKVGNLWLEL